MPHRVLIADDDTNARKGLRGLLEAWGYEIAEAADGEEAKRKAVELLPAVVIADLRMPRLDGLKLLDVLQAEAPFSSIILLTGYGSVETAVEAMKRGAYDYLTKPVDISRLRVLLEKAVERGETMREVRILCRRLQSVWGLGKMVGTSAPMQELYRLVEMAGPTGASVLITGESGTGKELVARSLHDLSPRSASPFVAVNCSAIPETLLESEIFGHEKGAFTGAADRRMGCFELAHNGTLFLDEIVEMGPAIQARFLRVLQDGTVRRVGGGTEFQADVRVIAATNKEPAQAIKEGILREDFFYRLNLFHLHIPPLRMRGGEDLSLLVQAFIEEFNEKYGKTIHGIEREVEQIFWMHAWPGNVRELRNCIERAVIVCEADLIGRRHIPPFLIGAGDPNDPEDQVTLAVGTTVEEAEKSLILKTLAAEGNNKTRAATLLGISIKTLHNKLQRYETRWAHRFRRDHVPPQQRYP